MKEIKVRLFSNYDSSEDLTRRFKNNYSGHENINLTINEDYDVAVVFNSTTEIKKNFLDIKIITIIQEPSWSPAHQNNPFLYCSNYLFIHDRKIFEELGPQLGEEVIETPSLMWFHDHINYTYFMDEKNFVKTKPLSMIVSSLNGTSGIYEKRYGLLQKILDSDLEIDIYGKGLSITDKRYKGPLRYKYNGLAEYKYSICIENSVENNYLSEKYIDAMLCSTIPIYYGAPNVKNIYQIGHDIIDINSPAIISDIKNIVNHDQSTYNCKKAYVHLNKFKYFNQYNLVFKILDIINLEFPKNILLHKTLRQLVFEYGYEEIKNSLEEYKNI